MTAANLAPHARRRGSLAIRRVIRGIVALTAAALVAGCATGPTDAALRARAADVMKASFKPNGQAQLDRLDQDEVQRVCSEFANRPLPPEVAARIERASLATMQFPADGKLAGDWKEGEKIAQEGRGKQFSDDPKGPAGANCYACHQLAPQELSYGTIGPSLYQFGRKRGFTEETRRYAWSKVWNADAFQACSLMPRFGHKAILTEQQVRDVVALLTDPASPVNQ